MFNTTNHTDDLFITNNRISIGFYSVLMSIWVCLLVRTLIGSRLPFVIGLSSLFIGFYICTITAIVLENWYYEEEDLTKKARIRIGNDVMSCVANFLFYEAQWIFAWRYWKVSELLSKSRTDKQLLNDTGIVVVSVVMSILILVNMTVDCYFFLTRDYNGAHFTHQWFPFTFMLIDAVVMCVAVFRVWNILKHEQMVSLNEKYMGALSAYLIALAISTFIANRLNLGESVWMWTLYSLVDFCVSLLIAFMMW